FTPSNGYCAGSRIATRHASISCSKTSWSSVARPRAPRGLGQTDNSLGAPLHQGILDVDKDIAVFDFDGIGLDRHGTRQRAWHAVAHIKGAAMQRALDFVLVEFAF